MKNITLAVNLKDYLSAGEAVNLIKTVDGYLGERPLPEGVQVIFAPPDTALWATALDDYKGPLHFALQDFHCDAGAHTGKKSLQNLLKDFEVSAAIIGHSEVRAAGDDVTIVRAKFGTAVDAGVPPILCVGETAEQRKQGSYLSAIARQLLDACGSSLTTYDACGNKIANTIGLTVAYEPIWAIGSAAVPDPPACQPEDIAEVVESIRQGLRTPYRVDNLKFLYGGSVKATNAKKILSIDSIDGLLIGRAGADFDEFARIIEIARDVATSSHL